MKNILNKLDLGMKFFIIAIFGIALIYCILSFVFDLFEGEKKEELLDINNVDKYISIYSEDTGETELDKDKLVKDYSTFYMLQSAVQNYINALIEGKYSKTYNIMSEEMKDKYSKAEYLKSVEEFTNNNFVNADSTYDLDYCLVRAYNIETLTYLCECRTLNADKNIRIGIKLNITDSTYTICYLDF